MSKKQAVIVTAVVLFVVIGVTLGIFLRREGGLIFPGGREDGANGPAGEVREGGTVIFKSEVPQNAKPTPPAISAPAAPGAEEKLNIFNMTVSAAGYSPNSITLKKGDIMTIRLTAQGGDYDIQIPYTGHYAKVLNGETKEISVGMNTSGTYTFLCRDFCPGSRTISGSIIVLPQ